MLLHTDNSTDKLFDTVCIVRTVQHDTRKYRLHPALPPRAADPLRDHGIADRMLRIDRMNRSDCKRAVHQLILREIWHCHRKRAAILFIIPAIQQKINAFVRLIQYFTHLSAVLPHRRMLLLRRRKDHLA